MRKVLAALALLSLACAGVDQPTQPPAASYAPTTSGQPAQPTQQAVAYSVQGPIAGPDGALVWMDTSGRLTGMYPDQGMLMFGTSDQLAWTRDAYGGWYAVQGGQLVPISGMPPELVAWPGVQSGLPGGYTLPAPQPPPAQYASSGGYDPSTISIMSDINDMYHDTNMQIIENMGDGRAGPVTDYYNDDGTYVGSW